MFDHIGGKIKNVAKAVCWIGISLSILLGLILLIALSTDSPAKRDLSRGFSAKEYKNIIYGEQ